MAISVRESREGRLAELLRLLMPFPGRLEFATRLALICALTTLVVEIYQTPDPALTSAVGTVIADRPPPRSVQRWPARCQRSRVHCLAAANGASCMGRLFDVRIITL